MKLWQKISIFALSFFPYLVFAQDQATKAVTGAAKCGQIKTIANIFDCLTGIISASLIPLLFAIALIVFIWGVIQYITAGGDQEERRKGIQYIIWGIVGLFVMTAVW